MICDIMEYMQLSEIELKTLQQIANDNIAIKKIAETLNKDLSRIYRTKNKLIEKNYVEFFQGRVIPKKITHIHLLLQLLIKYPNIINVLSRSGIPIFTELLHSKTVEEVELNTKLKKSIIYKKIKQGIDINAIIQKKNYKYVINEKIWKELKDFLLEYKKHEETTDSRVPTSSIIYHKNQNEIVFSNKADLDAVLSGFSAYEKHGIKILLTTNYYYLPKKSLSKQEIFRHSLYITQKEKNIRNLTFICLFYLKNKNNLLSIKHPITDKIRQILKGKNIQNYPTLEEIKEKAEIYDIRI
ncbi:hypothetical protein MBGDF03_00828 [Thermoplasmatales archaeon SCGC AB-540-F20]|nr:hypothetical protein MBGDF03_00828 [Thermoplasmatales archaeon SCGC AB-540-F20]